MAIVIRHPVEKRHIFLFTRLFLRRKFTLVHALREDSRGFRRII